MAAFLDFWRPTMNRSNPMLKLSIATGVLLLATGAHAQKGETVKIGWIDPL